MMVAVGLVLGAIAAIEVYAMRERRSQRRRHGGLLRLDTPAARRALRSRRPW